MVPSAAAANDGSRTPSPGADAPRSITRPQLETLLAVSGALASSLDLAVVLQTAVERAVEVLDLETGAIYTLSDQTLYLGATTPPIPRGFPLHLRYAVLGDHPHIRRSITEGEPVYLRDARSADLAPAEREAVESRDLATLLYVPLIAKGSAIGVLILGTRHQVVEFPDDHLDLCRTLAHLVALAVMNAQLHEAMTETHRDLEESATLTREYADRLASMAAVMATNEDRERRHLADELHDRVSQSLAMAKMHLALSIAEREVPDPSEVRLAADLLDEAIGQTRVVMGELAPTILFDLGLPPALQKLCDEMESRLGLRVHTSLSIEPCTIDDDAAALLYRAARELLTNILKHAGVSDAWLSLDVLPDGLQMTVRDEGRGLPEGGSASANAGTGYGLFAMREHLVHSGGSFELHSSRGGGTTVVVRVPCV